MNFYKHYIGDFQRDTGQLSLTERGAYLALIHHYYATELPLPNSLDALCRIAGAVNSAERKAVKSVMQYFETVESGLMHARIEAELHKAGDRSEKNRSIALEREEKRRAEKLARSEHEPSTKRAQNVHESSTNRARTEHEPSTKGARTEHLAGANQTPDTRHHTPIVPKGTSVRFPEFWLLWPATERKEAKASCEKKWRSLNLDPLADRILSHVSSLKTTRKWQEGFEPAPLTFLNQRRWEDGEIVGQEPAWAGAK